MLERGDIAQHEYDIVKADLLADMSNESLPTAPGWYNDPSGQMSHQAYWDGQQWTGETRPSRSAEAPSTGQVAARSLPSPSKSSKGFSIGKVLLYGFLGLVAVGVASAIVGSLGSGEVEETFSEIASGLGGDGGSGATLSNGTEARTSETSASASQFTRSQENAVASAESYLSFSAFSRSGLIDQLEFEGFANAEAALAVDYLEVDWNAQASLSAESYLDSSAFSKSGLSKQLEFEGFTSNQAAHAVNSVTVDWNDQARKKAEEYLEFSSFSRSGLIDQLLFEGFTQSQATYGVDKAGL